MSVSAFASVLEKANKQADDDRLAAEQRDREATERRQQAERDAAERAARELLIRNCRHFGDGFLLAVAKWCDKKVTERKWKDPAATVTAIQVYAEALLKLSGDPSDLPSLDPQLADQVLDKFAYGMHLAEKRGQAIPDGMLVGQRIDGFVNRLASKRGQNDEQSATPQRIKFEAGSKLRGPRSVRPTNVADDLPPAFTPKRKGKK